MSAFKSVRQRVDGTKDSLSLTFGRHRHPAFVFFVMRSDNRDNHPLFIGLPPVGDGSRSDSFSSCWLCGMCW